MRQSKLKFLSFLIFFCLILYVTSPIDGKISIQDYSESVKMVRQQDLVRFIEDQPDDVEGYQIHFLYVLPADSVDEEHDVLQTLHMSVDAIQQWFRNKSGGLQLNIDTINNQIDITFLQLTSTNQELMILDSHMISTIAMELNTAGFNQAMKKYALFYGGDSNYGCGHTTSIGGQYSALYFNAINPQCATRNFTNSASTPGYLEFAMLHVILQTLGISQVFDSPSDIMYGGGEFPWFPTVIDAGNDDYFQHGLSKLDLYDSPYLTHPGDIFQETTIVPYTFPTTEIETEPISNFPDSIFFIPALILSLMVVFGTGIFVLLYKKKVLFYQKPNRSKLHSSNLDQNILLKAKFCSNCGNSIQLEDIYCFNCGNLLSE